MGMSAHDELLALIAQMHADGAQLTYECILERRGRGSRRDISRALRAWHAQHAHHLVNAKLDRDAGLDAREAYLDTRQPAAKADIHKRHEDYVAARRDKKTPMQAASGHRGSEHDKPILGMDVTRLADTDAATAAIMLRTIADYVTQLETAALSDAMTIAALQQEVSDVRDELKRTKQELQITSDEYSDMIRRRDAGWD